MKKNISKSFLLGICQLDKTAKVPLFVQLANCLQKAIHQGILTPELCLPSIRDMAVLFDVSRNTVSAALQQLIIEGYLESRPRSGIYVTNSQPDLFLQARLSHADMSAKPAPVRLSKRGESLASVSLTFNRHCDFHNAFSHGVPALDAFPFDIWARLTNHQYRSAPLNLFNDFAHSPAGYRPLREALAEYIRTARGVHCTPEQLIIVAGSQQGLYITAQLLLDPGDGVWIEDPGYPGARLAFSSAGAKLVPIPIGNHGMDVEYGRRNAAQARLAYVTPSHQFPLGVTMSIATRMSLLRWAMEQDAWIIEDDYDSEYRYQGQPIPALQGLDTAGRVIYMGTFSKVMYPSIRLGYLVVPSQLIEAYTKTRKIIDVQSPTVSQAALSEFITQGHFTRHIRRMRRLYESRLTEFLSLLQEHCPDQFTLGPTDAGMHVTAYLNGGGDDDELAKYAARHRVDVVPLSRNYIGDNIRRGLIMGFTGVTSENMRPSMERFAQAVTEWNHRSIPCG